MGIVGTVVVIVGAAEKPVALIVARRHHRVMAARRGVALEHQERPAMVRIHLVAYDREQPRPGGAAMLHGEVLVHLPCNKGPEIDDLVAMGVGDLDGLAFGKTGRLAAAGGDHLQLCHVFAVLLLLGASRPRREEGGKNFVKGGAGLASAAILPAASGESWRCRRSCCAAPSFLVALAHFLVALARFLVVLPVALFVVLIFALDDHLRDVEAVAEDIDVQGAQPEHQRQNGTSGGEGRPDDELAEGIDRIGNGLVHFGPVGHGIEALKDQCQLAIDLGFEGLDLGTEDLARVVDGVHRRRSWLVLKEPNTRRGSRVSNSTLSDQALIAAAAVSEGRLWQSIESMAEIGGLGNGGVTRQALTREDIAARAVLIGWAEARGLEARIGEAANLFLRRPGQDPEAAPVLAGSHMDSQPAGGRFDGIYGVLAAFEAMQALDDAGIVTRRPIDVVAWTNEE